MKKSFRVALATCLFCCTLGTSTAFPSPATAEEQTLAPGHHTLTLPDGRTLSDPGNAEADYQNLHIDLEVIGIARINKATPFSADMAVGNHAEVLHEESVRLPYGTARFALVERTAPSAEMSDKATKEYWLVMVGKAPNREDMSYAYSIIATVNGNETGTKEKLIRIAQNWKLPITPLK